MGDRICRKIYDAHIHFPVRCEKPYIKLLDEIHASGLDGGLLIINNSLEENCFWTHFDSIMSGGLGFVPSLAFILDVHSENWIDTFRRLDNNNLKYMIKIHPRISNITLSDFDRIIDLLSCIDSNTIIVDNWIFGPTLENHIGTELAIFLAEHLCEKKIVIAHSGGVRLLETMLLTRPLNNVFYDLSETCQYFPHTSVYMDMIHFIKWTNSRIMFGSDYPDFRITDSITIMEEALRIADLSEIDISNVMYGNAKRIYEET